MTASACRSMPIAGEPSEATDSIARVVAKYWALPVDRVNTGPSSVTAISRESRFNSEVAVLPPHAGRPRSFIKMIGEPSYFQRECRGMAAAQALPQHDTVVRVPKILYTARADQAIVTEYIAGQHAKAALRKAYLRLPAWYTNGARDLGRWLAAYHELPCDPATQAELWDRHSGYMEHCLERAAPRLGRSQVRVIRSVIDCIAERVRSRTIRPVYGHGDLDLENVIVSNGRLYVVDFAYSGPAYRELDLMGFQHSLRRSIGYLPCSKPAAHRLWSAFLDGYGRGRLNNVDRDIRAMLQLRYLVDLIAYPFDDDAGFGARRLIQLYMLRRTMRSLRSWLVARAPAYGIQS